MVSLIAIVPDNQCRIPILILSAAPARRVPPIMGAVKPEAAARAARVARRVNGMGSSFTVNVR
jgi:hypothetical protein